MAQLLLECKFLIMISLYCWRCGVARAKLVSSMTECWALTDYRPGTANQVLGVARATGFHVTEKKLHYNKFADLPNYFMLGNGLRGISKDHRAAITSPYPDIVISAGRRSAPIAAHIKARNPATRLVHIMRPEWSHIRFDMIIMPRHDRAQHSSNVVTTLGAPHQLTDEMLFTARSRNPLNADRHAKPYTLICIGGKTSQGAFTIDDGKKLVASLAPFSGRGTFLVTTSRRTPNALAHSIFERLAKEYPHMQLIRYMPEQGGDNPYYAWLAQADRVVVTADSVSMISEAAYTAKPLYYFAGKENVSDKHQRFVEQMVEHGHLKAIRDYDPLWTKAVKLDEAARIGAKIRELMKR